MWACMRCVRRASLRHREESRTFMTLAAEGLKIRRAMLEDAPACGQICYDAFSTINQAHNFPCDFPGPEVTTGVLSMMFSAPDFYCVVAEREGRIVGSNC